MCNTTACPPSVGRFLRKFAKLMLTAVHPHACGEISNGSSIGGPIVGTSPRLWGDSDNARISRQISRYIPTLVGRLFTMESAQRIQTVHPHACGEIWISSIFAKLNHGTSPRLWGDYEYRFASRCRSRYIPTLVGRFSPQSIRRWVYQVHPHACGEISLTVSASPLDNGTSPRLWGDSSLRQHTRRYWRYIPTLVGRLDKGMANILMEMVHPHACGEINTALMRRCPLNGTSPRLWGDFFPLRQL